MASTRFRAFHLMLVFVASMMAFVLTPTAGEAHGSDYGGVAILTPGQPALSASVVDDFAAGADLQQVQNAAESSLAAQADDLAAHHRDAGDTNCPSDGSCCSATCHMLIDLVGPFLGARTLVSSAGVPPQASLVLASPIIGLFRPPRSL